MEKCELISVIVPIYNTQDYLKRCVDSLLHQTYSNLEIILVDDGSTDESGTICDEYSALDNRVCVIHKINGGLSSARNTGLDVAKGSYIGFVDGDDYIAPDMYENMITALKTSGADIACVGIVVEYTEKGRRKVIRCPAKMRVYDDKSAISQILRAREIGISVCTKLYTRSVFNHVRFPLNETNEDSAVMLDTLLGRSIVHTAVPAYYYFKREGSITHGYSAQLHYFIWRNATELAKRIFDELPQLIPDVEYYMASSLIATLSAYQSQKTVYDENAKVYFAEYKKRWRCLLHSPDLSFRKKCKAVFIRFQVLKVYYWLKGIR